MNQSKGIKKEQDKFDIEIDERENGEVIPKLSEDNSPENTGVIETRISRFT